MGLHIWAYSAAILVLCQLASRAVGDCSPNVYLRRRMDAWRLQLLDTPMILDFIRELRIEYHLFMGCSSRPHSKECRKHFDKMAELIRKRSPEQVRKMERAKGLQ